MGRSRQPYPLRSLFHARNLLAAMRAGDSKRVSRALAYEVAYRGTSRGRGWTKTQAVDAEPLRLAVASGDHFAVTWSTAISAVAHYLAGYFGEALAKCVTSEASLVEFPGSLGRR